MRTVTRADIAQITGYSAKYVRDNLTKRPNAQGDGSRRKEHCGLVPRPLQPEGLTWLSGWMKIQCLQISGSRVVQARGLWEWNSPAGYKMASNRQTREWPMEPLI